MRRGPMLLASWLRGIPNVIFEPNAEPGFTNRVVARFAKRIATGYEVTAKAWGAKAQLTGCPVRPEFFLRSSRANRKGPAASADYGRKPGRALPVNRAFVDAMDLLATRKKKMKCRLCTRLANAIIMR